MDNYYRYQYYYDSNTNTVISNRTLKNVKNEWVYLGEWFAHEQTPYVSGKNVVRNYYNKKIIILEI